MTEKLLKRNPPILDYKSKILLCRLVAILQKIVAHHFRNYHKLLNANTFPPKQLIYVRFLTIDGFG